MPDPEGSLTPSQFEILQLLWDSDAGLSVAEIWESIKEHRDVSRTTILNLVDRLEKREWLERKKAGGIYRYSPTVDRQATEGRLASEFVEEFFDGSTSSFILSLIGSKRISTSEVQQLKSVLAEEAEKTKSKTGKR